MIYPPRHRLRPKHPCRVPRLAAALALTLALAAPVFAQVSVGITSTPPQRRPLRRRRVTARGY